MEEQLRIPFDEVLITLTKILLDHGFNSGDASLSARLFAEATADGVYSHGLNRFPRYIDYVSKGYIQVKARPILVQATGIYEVWDGNSGPGNLNAWRSMERAISLAKLHGTGIVALRNTNHWMRGGTYGWQAAGEGCIGICFTNTKPNMPPWGADKPLLGNNPLVIAIPAPDGHMVLDMAMSQFAYGKLETLAMTGEKLPFPGGYNQQGILTDDPREIIASERILPAGYWKGSGLAMMLDLVAAMLSGGLATHDIGKLEAEHSLSQVFVAFDSQKCDFKDFAETTVRHFKTYLAGGTGAGHKNKARYPGERVMEIRWENMKNGLPVNNDLWSRLKALAGNGGDKIF